MLKIRSLLLVVAASFTVASVAYAAGGGGNYDKANIQPDNIASLQRGAANFMNYCAACHSAQYIRYSTIGKHLELSDQQLIDNLMFNAEQTFETIQVSMNMDSSVGWFGNSPPDLSLTARSKGADYIYTFLKSFYLDDSRANGTNNTVLKGSAMPHVLWELEGLKKAIYEDKEADDGTMTKELVGFEQVTQGTLTPDEYENFVLDTTNFLAYIAEPVRSERRVIGVWVMLFLTVFLILAIMLKKEIWKDVK